MKRVLVMWVVVIGLCLSGLFAFQRPAHASISQDAECAARTASILADKAGYTREQAATLTGCAQDSAGSWFWPDSDIDARLPAPVLTDEENTATSDLNATLKSQINDFLDALAAIPDQFNPASSALPNLLVSLSELTEGGTSFGLGAAPGINPGAPGIQSAAKYYANLLVSFARDPNHLEFARYVTWWSQSRYAAMPVGVQSMNPMARGGYINAMGFGRAPWPWELQRIYTIAEYRKWAFTNGFVATRTPTALVQPPGSQATQGGSSGPAASIDISALLPSLADVPPGFVVVSDRSRTLNELAQNYRDPAETAARFTAWGWRGNVTRTFGLADANAAPVDGTYSLYVSIHQFGDTASVSAALDYSFGDQLASTGATEMTAPMLGDRSRAMSGSGSDGNEVTLYLQRGAVLLRVTAISNGGDPTGDALALAKGVLAK